MNNSMFDVSGKVAVITGAAKSLGLGYAEGFLKAGAKVALIDMDEATLTATVNRLKEDGYPAWGYCFDVSDENAVCKYIDLIESEVGPIDILINNAGIQKRAPFPEMPLEDWRKVININLTGVFIMGQTVAKKMIPRRSGKIINVSSINSVLARANISPYCAAKGGINTLTKSMATELGEYGICTNAIAPGYMNTEMTRPLVEDPEFDGWVKSEVPLKRWGKPEDLVGAAIFLASSASDYVNGQTLHIDGGWQACL